MGFIDSIRAINIRTVALFVLAVLPYVDQETLGLIPFVRDILPGVTPIPFFSLSWTERARLAVFIVVPYLFDGETWELLTGRNIMEIISD